MQLPAEIDVILEKKYCKRYMVRSFCAGSGKIIFALLTEVIANYAIITFINIRKACFERTLASVFYSHDFDFYYWSNNILQFFIWINPWQSFGPAKADISILRGFEGRAWVLASSFELLKGDSNLDEVEPIGLKIQPWTLQGRLRVPEAMENKKTLEKFLKDLSWYYPNKLANLLNLKLLEL